jgi:hypothetical protein
MRTFYTGSDIEDLAAHGIRQLELGPGVALTDTARERAEELGIALLVPGSAPASKPATPASTTKGAALPPRPKGCQHGPLTTKASRPETAGVGASSGASGGTAGGSRSGNAVVEQLVEAVSALKKRGG